MVKNGRKISCVGVLAPGAFNLWPLQSLANTTYGQYDLWPLRSLATSTSGQCDLWPLQPLASSSSATYEFTLSAAFWPLLANVTSGQYESVAPMNIPLAYYVHINLALHNSGQQTWLLHGRVYHQRHFSTVHGAPMILSCPVSVETHWHGSFL